MAGRVRLLEIENLHSYYGQAHVVQGTSITVQEGETVVLLGRNGMGKTTLIRSIMGMRPPDVRRGVIRYRGTEVNGKGSHEIARLGVGLVPQGRRIFASLTTEENLVVAARGESSDSWNVATIMEMFPGLADRRRNLAEQLSGGEQSMLSIGRALMTCPTLLLMDEPSEGLAPVLVEQLGETIRALKEGAVTIVLVEQHLGLATKVADRICILEQGRIVHEAQPGELEEDRDLRTRFLGVA